MRSRGLARPTARTNQASGGRGESRGKLANVAGAGRLAVTDDAMDGRKGHIGCLGKLKQSPPPLLTQAVNPTSARVWVVDTRHSHSIPQNGTECKDPDDSIPQNGTHVSGTIEDVATPKPHPEYVAMLRHYIDELTRLGVEVGPTTTLWRFTSDRPNAKPTLKAAESIRSVIQARMPGVDIPPPVVAVRTDEHFKWIALGEWLLDHDPHTFARLLERIVDIKKGREAQFALGAVDQTHDPGSDL